jgi:hypothetical protein
MSEKAECPRCGSYVSEIFYDRRHRHCGWNCNVEWTLSAWNDGESAKLRLKERPTAKQRNALAALVGADSTTTDVSVDGYRLEGIEAKSPWFDLDRDPPRPLPAQKAKAALKDLRDRLVEQQVAGIDSMLET